MYIAKPPFAFSLFTGDIPYEAHVQTHRGGAPSEPSVTTEDRVPQHPHTHLPHLSSLTQSSHYSQQHSRLEFISHVRLAFRGPAHTVIYIKPTLAYDSWHKHSVLITASKTSPSPLSFHFDTSRQDEHSVFMNVTMQLDIAQRIRWLGMSYVRSKKALS